MGTIRMVVLDGLTVSDLLALRQGGFFEGAEVRLPGTASTTPVAVPVAVPAPALPSPVPRPVAAEPGVEPVVEVTAEQAATLAAFQAELAPYRAERGPPAAQDARSAGGTGIDVTPVPVAAPDAPAAGSGGLPSVAQLSACTKLRDVLQVLIDGGLAADQLTPYLESVRGQVPLLQRIANIPERVARTLSVMQVQG